MKSLVLLFAALAFSAPTFGGDVLKVRAKNYTCQELKNIVQEEGTVHIYGFGSRLVHSSEKACRGYKFGEPQEAFKTSWKTSDKRFCVAGYSCQIRQDDF